MRSERDIAVKLPDKVEFILRKLQDAGYEAFAVGGCVRDALLSRVPGDWDITTSALPGQVKALFPRTVDTGLKHGTVTVLCGKEGFEVTTYRVDGAYEDGRHPSTVTFTRSLSEDLCRRDFTINAMAYNPDDGLVDLFGGREDLERRIIRAVGDPRRRFGEDALRIMRAVRFAAQLGFDLDEETALAIRELSPTLAKVSAERIRTELEKTILSDRPQMLRVMYETGITAQMLPEFDACMRTPQNNPHHCYPVGEHILAGMANVRADKVLRLTLLLHDICKPDCRTTDEAGIDHFYGHAEKGSAAADRILRRLKYDNETRRKVVTLVKYHDTAIRLTPAGVRKAVVTVGEDLFPLLLEVKRADMYAQSSFHREEKEERLRVLEKLYGDIIRRGDCLNLKGLAVKGNDIVAAGIGPGTAVGDLLAAMMDEVLAVPEHNNRDYLMRRFLGKTSGEEKGINGKTDIF